MNTLLALNNNCAQFDTNWFISFQAYEPYIGVYLIVYISIPYRYNKNDEFSLI